MHSTLTCKFYVPCTRYSTYMGTHSMLFRESKVHYTYKYWSTNAFHVFPIMHSVKHIIAVNLSSNISFNNDRFTLIEVPVYLYVCILYKEIHVKTCLHNTHKFRVCENMLQYTWYNKACLYMQSLHTYKTCFHGKVHIYCRDRGIIQCNSSNIYAPVRTPGV